MPWEKNFNVDATLTQAMQAFWANGFTATSMQDLVTTTGVNRASLYATYGDKRALFMAALRRYDIHVRGQMLADIAAREPPIRAIAAVFDRFISQAQTPQRNWGCLLINSALELAPHDPDVAAIVNRAQDDIEAFFLRLIHQGQAHGDIGDDINAAQFARQALATLLGLIVMVRSRPDERYLSTVRDGFLGHFG